MWKKIKSWFSKPKDPKEITQLPTNKVNLGDTLPRPYNPSKVWPPAEPKHEPGDDAVIARVAGIDVSHHQGLINWREVAASGVRFALIKATEGESFRDSQFATNVRGAQANGILVGAYHFFKPTSDPVKAAATFLSMVSKFKIDLPYILDWEKDEKTGDADEIHDAQIILDIFEKNQGRVPWIYTGDWYFKNISNAGQFKRYPLWLSDYSPEKIAIPKPWGKVALLQYSSSGAVPGIKGKCDLNWFNGTLDELRGMK